MHHLHRRRAGTTACVTLALTLALASTAWAAPISLIPGSLNMFRDTRGLNDVGDAQGDLLQYGADIAGGSAGMTVGAVHPSGAVDPPVACAPLATNKNICANVAPFDPNLLTPWTFTFTNGPDRFEIAGPSLAGAEAPVPFPVSVRLSGSGATPTILWEAPAGFAPDGIRINIYDKRDRVVTGVANLIHSVAIPPTSTSYQIPSGLSSGKSLVEGRPYSIAFQLIETRDHVPFKNINGDILRRSNAYFAFTPRADAGPSDINLPMVGPDPDPTDDRGAAYVFSIQGVGPDNVTYIDPAIASGYVFEIGDGDPSFASVVLPNVGDGMFDVVVDGQSTSVKAGDRLFFRPGGVSTFTVLGIEPEANVDPGNVTAFVTGLTFAGAGAFTGTMTPLTVAAP
jgi:hypothetical protein